MDDTPETLEQIQARHRKEAKDLQGRITSKKKNATKKTRRGVNSECDELERALKERQSAEIAALSGSAEDDEKTTPGEEEEDEDDDEDVNGAAKKLDALKVDDELGAKPPQQPVDADNTTQSPQQQGAAAAGGGGAGPGKKRNRQKERLARRAAETEAAALAAEQEASHQTDHRSIEKTHMLAEFTKHSLVEHEIQPDGHCLFSAVADQLAQLAIPLDRQPGEPGYKAVRRLAAEYIGAHGEEYSGFLEEGVDSYVRKIRDTAEWGGQIELAAVANVWGVEVWVVQDGETEVVRPQEGGEGREGKRIWLAYYRHGYGLGEHYNSLRKT